MKSSLLLIPLTIALTSACEPRTADGRTAATDAGSNASTDSTVLQGTPPGDLPEWVADMRTGLDSVAKQVAGPRSAVHVGVLTLYATRQEFLEAYYGTSGRMGPTPALAEAVMTAEARFHDLMRLTSATPAAEAAAIRAAIAAVDQQLAMVLELRNESDRRVRAEGK